MAGQIRERGASLFPPRHSALIRTETADALADLQSLKESMARAHRQSVGQVLPKRPAGAFTVNEYAEAIGKSQKTATSQLWGLVKLGDWERLKAYHPTADGRLVATFFYREKQ